jgi:putative addiction module CopG family antidote
MTIQVKLPPALEKFAEDCVAEGRYEDVDAVVRSALDLLQRQEAWRRDLAESIEESIAEAEPRRLFHDRPSRRRDECDC